MTHATLALGRADLGAALCAHPVAPLVLLLVAWGGWHLFRGRGARLSAPAVLAAIAGIWAVNLLTHIHKVCG